MVHAVENIPSDFELTHEPVILISDKLRRGIFYNDRQGIRTGKDYGE